ncbi:hypothetical protein D920_01393 [Enterococcus faecalis 13-SD-W-01]|nr:hypothetical protein D920_01393 [Enterococcus faecalis 13-SD-W-01]
MSCFVFGTEKSVNPLYKHCYSKKHSKKLLLFSVFCSFLLLLES